MGKRNLVLVLQRLEIEICLSRGTWAVLSVPQFPSLYGKYNNTGVSCSMRRVACGSRLETAIKSVMPDTLPPALKQSSQNRLVGIT